MNNPGIKAQEEDQEVVLTHAESHLMGLGEDRQHGEPLTTFLIQEQNHPTEMLHREGLPLRHLNTHQLIKDYYQELDQETGEDPQTMTTVDQHRQAEGHRQRCQIGHQEIQIDHPGAQADQGGQPQKGTAEVAVTLDQDKTAVTLGQDKAAVTLELSKGVQEGAAVTLDQIRVAVMPDLHQVAVTPDWDYFQ